MSSINPNNIDGAYPIAGQDNDSQGFRDNFTNIKNNLTFAKSEIEDLQNNAILKSALTGTVLNNNMAGAALIGPVLRDYSENVVDKGTLSGAVTFDFTAGSYQKVTTSGSITLTFSNFPDANYHGRLRLLISVANTGHTVTFPSSVTGGLNDIQGVNETTRVFTATATGNYLFEISSIDGGTNYFIDDILRNRDVNTEAESAVFSDFLTVSNTSPLVTPSSIDYWGNIANTSVNSAQFRVQSGAIFEQSLYANVVIGNHLQPKGNVKANVGIYRYNGNLANVAAHGVGIGTAYGDWVFDSMGRFAPATNLSGNIGSGTSRPYTITAGKVLDTVGVLVTSSPNAVASGGTVSVTETASYFTTTGGTETSTLSNVGVSTGQIKTLARTGNGGGTMRVSVSSPGWRTDVTGNIILDAQGDGCTLQWLDSKWCVIGNNGCTFT